MPAILILDDDPDLLFVTGTLVGLLGYRAVTASRFSEADAILDREPIDLVVCDVQMTEASGLDYFTQKRAANPALPPFLFVSGLPAAMSEPYPAGVVGFLQKPVRLERMERAILDGLRKKDSADLSIEH